MYVYVGEKVIKSSKLRAIIFMWCLFINIGAENVLGSKQAETHARGLYKDDVKSNNGTMYICTPHADLTRNYVVDLCIFYMDVIGLDSMFDVSSGCSIGWKN